MTTRPNTYQLFPSLSEGAFDDLKVSIASYRDLGPCRSRRSGCDLGRSPSCSSMERARAEGHKIPTIRGRSVGSSMRTTRSLMRFE